MQRKDYLAHISEDNMREQSLLEHLEEVGKLAEKFASAFGQGEVGRGIGNMHDVGKGSIPFQERLHGAALHVDHSTAGARELFYKKTAPYVLGAYCVAGHHGGLPDGGTIADSAGMPTLHGRMRKKLEPYEDFFNEMSLPDWSDFSFKGLGKGGFSFAFLTRMLFSCLVDADYLDTEHFMKGELREDIGGASIEVLFDKFKQYIGDWLNNDDSNTINGRRSEILKACLAQGTGPQRLYQLTVPTGGGKTTASMAFALQHAMTHNLDRIIYVIPYVSIIEQTAEVFRNIFGAENVLENHCNVNIENPEELKLHQLAAENFDKRIIVTTNVQFFESLFSNKPAKCRKIHNFAKSIIIFDEAQMLPVNYLFPCIRAISELIYNYRCTAVLCTATQPALLEYFPKEISSTAAEICPNVEDQYQFFKRSKVEHIGEISEETLADRLESRSQVLCILTSRKNVRNIYNLLKSRELPGIYHLSTLMYPEHRKGVLAEIKQCLKEGAPCRVIATSLIEAGVDVDFPSVFRELAGVDSIIQAAGRCNREGKRPLADSRAFFFTLKGQSQTSLPGSLRQPISATEQIAREYEDVSELNAIHQYFKRLYKFKGEGLDVKAIVRSFEAGAKSLSFPFAAIAKEFHLIEQDSLTVFIPKEKEAELIKERLCSGQASRSLMRAAGRYCVNIFEREYKTLYDAGALDPVFDDFAVLTDLGQYDEECGLILNTEGGAGLFY